MLRASSPASESETRLQPVHDATLCIIGGGLVGMIIARDAASCDHSSIVLESERVIGGVWSKNDYPGLGLQHSGAAYRCLSLAPSWQQ